MSDETPEQKTARENAEARDRELNERIVAGVTAGLKPVIEKLSERDKHESVVTRSAEPVTITRPTEEQIAQAQIDGNVAELARLNRLVRQADQQERQRELASISGPGGAAISSVSRIAAQQNPFYKKYQKEIDAEMDKFKASYPGAIVTPEHYDYCIDIVRGRHVQQEIDEGIEESRRKAREDEAALLPDNSHHEVHVEKEPTNLKDALDVPDWNLFKEKQKSVGGRTDNEELRKMGYKNGLPEFLATRKKNAKIEEEVGSGLGLDRDWVWTDKSKGEGHYV